MFGLRKRILGLDLGARSLKGVVLARRGKEVVLEDYFYYDLREAPGEAMPDTGEVLSALVDGAGLRNRQVACALPDKEVQIANFRFPSMKPDEMRAVVLNELEGRLGEAARDLSVDYVEVPRPAGREVDVKAHFAKLELVRARADLLTFAKLRPVALESDMQATLEALRFGGYVSEQGAQVVVDVGETHTSVALVLQGELHAVTVKPNGAGDINASLMQEFQWTYKDSELLKLSYKMEKEEAAQSTEGKLVEQGYYEIILGIHDTVAYFKASNKDQILQNVLLTGGGSLQPGVAALVEQSLNIPVVQTNPLRNVQIFPKRGQEDERLPHLSGLLHVAVGLALRGVA